MSCTAADLISIQPLALSDTFNTWFDRTNEIITAASAINVLDVNVGPTAGGILKETGCSAGYYNGVVTLSVDPGAGIGIGTSTFTNSFNKVVIDAVRLEDLGASANPDVSDYYIVSDLSDTRQGPVGTAKRVRANRLLPPEVYFGNAGEGSFDIHGNVTIHGNIVVEGTQSYIDTNDLRIEDRVIELAYNRYSQFIVSKTGMTSGSILLGATAYYIDPGSAGVSANATTVGFVRDFSYVSGITGAVQLHAFTEGGVSDIVNGGSLVVDGGGLTFNITSNPVEGDAFYGDTLLTPAGVVVKGASGDKTFLWNYRTPDTLDVWNAFVANTNLGVTGSSNFILSSRFASYGYGAADDTFTFQGQGDSYTKAIVGQQLTLEHSPTGSGGITFGIVYVGSTGPAVYPNINVNDWVKHLNADQLDGAHALTTATPWSIPVSLVDGRIHQDWVQADAIRKKFSQTGHGFASGDVVRFDVDGSLTFAKADTIPTAEAIGMVESVTGSVISVVTKGFISGLTGPRINVLKPLVTGNVYYLSQSVGGGMIANPDSGAFDIDPGEVRKAVFLATSPDSGYVVNYTGVVVGNEPTDLIYLKQIAPVGAIQPFGGPTAGIPEGWLLCDGKVVDKNVEPHLFAAIGHNYHAGGSVFNSTTFTIDVDTRGLANNDALFVVWSSGSANVRVSSVDVANRRIILNSAPFASLPVGTALRIFGRTVPTTDGRSVYFLPDMRDRTAFGVSSTKTIGSVGGNGDVTLSTSNIPPHTHGLDASVATSISGRFGSTSAQTGALIGSGASPTPFSILPPYVSVFWIIRANPGVSATVLTGHNHDFQYIRYDITHSVTAGAGSTLTDANRAQFRLNAKVLRNDADDVFRGTLRITGGLAVDRGITAATTVSVGSNLVVAGESSFTGAAEFRNSVVMLTADNFTTVRMSPALNFGLVRSGATAYYDLNQRDADARNLVIDSKSGEVSCKPMYTVSENNPPASAAGYPEGFVWYQLAPTVAGSGLLESLRYQNTTPTASSPVGTMWYQYGIPWVGGLCPGNTLNCDAQPVTYPPAKGRWIFYRHAHYRDDNWDFSSFRVGNGITGIAGVASQGSIAFHPRFSGEANDSGNSCCRVIDRILWIKVSENA